MDTDTQYKVNVDTLHNYID